MFGLRRTATNVKVMSRFASTAAKASYDPVFQSYHLGRSVDLKQVEGLFDLTKSNGKGSVSFSTSAPGAGFDVYGFGSVVFYNTSNDFHQDTLAKINSLELSPADAVNAIEGYNFECSAQVGNPLNDPSLTDGDKEKLQNNIVVSVEKNRPAGFALAQVVALDYVDVALDRIIENISNLDEAGLNTAVKHLAGIMGSIEGRTIPKFDDASNEIAYKEMRQKGGLDDLYKELDFKLAVLTKQYNITL
mmetsp:Transcript_18685/g.34902  ORF Transcript_18685/g.34902 Transcript_18685/m.34902 type:complete len:246 (-) Transcript_18685:493-1230(-)|eukprot:CAMPEP_0114432122 /NCGR_PEP_ID=MMETSP0103-20121206/10981_1 /TAXON_ID=37642 ORGANISM="Paraphysomonas imperforata, Strain PA2" /NCGR_SAMPLE_ID=MMETSP0103 /ASSEMBLY_ACC=CAM_ASM_000201 /LENGTH=245 /DNA_ID=CAMNT_0001601765 /DNA_START=42 /DNA_END=779 /DNA_ORIENTATION=-